MNELCEKHLQTLKKQTEDANVTRHRKSPSTGRHRAQTATYQNLNFRTNRRKEMKDINERADHTKEHMGLTT